MHNFFNHSSVNEQIDCFHVWAIVNSAAMNIEVRVSFLKFNYFLMFGVALFIITPNEQQPRCFAKRQLSKTNTFFRSYVYTMGF